MPGERLLWWVLVRKSAMHALTAYRLHGRGPRGLLHVPRLRRAQRLLDEQQRCAHNLPAELRRWHVRDRHLRMLAEKLPAHLPGSGRVGLLSREDVRRSTERVWGMWESSGRAVSASKSETRRSAGTVEWAQCGAASSVQEVHCMAGTLASVLRATHRHRSGLDLIGRVSAVHGIRCAPAKPLTSDNLRVVSESSVAIR